MSAIITKFLKIDKAVQNIQDLNDGYYYFAGKSSAWDNESYPDDATNSNNEFNKVFDQMIFLKKASSTDGILCVPKFEWSTGNEYVKYKSSYSTRDLFKLERESLSSYCINNGNVYICLDNEGGYSTDSPIGASVNRFRLSDGYVWKFLFNLTPVVESKWTTSHWIPVPYLVSQKSADQLSVEDNTTSGTIDSITIVDGGTGHDANTTATILGDGSGATVDSITIDNGVITHIRIDPVGSDYTYASILFAGPGNSDEDVNIEISPILGHGADIKSDLYANYVLFSNSFSGDELGEFPTVNDYRQLGLIKNPLDKIGDPLTLDQYATTTILELSNLTGTYDFDETVISSSNGATGFVFDRDTSTVTLVGVNLLFTATGILEGETSFASANIIAVPDPDVGYKKYTGQIMYIENIKPIVRNTSQTESFRFVIEY